jgi:YegS/Rv2252/BmrU family lipid kinase
MRSAAGITRIMRTTNADHVHIVLNPAAGAGAGRRVRVELEEALNARGVDYRIEETRGRGNAVDLAAAAAAAGAPVVASVGGDGTAHEVVNGLLAAGTQPPRLALIPVGTGNDFVKMLGGGGRRAAYDALAAGTSRPIDVGIASWEGGREVFLNSAGTGIDVEVVRHMERMRGLPGGLVYLLALLRALVSYRPVPLSITVDGRELPTARIMMAAVSNGRCVGGSFRLSPEAHVDDGLLDLCRVDALGALASLRLTARIRQGTHTDHSAVTTRRGRVFVLRSEGPGPFHVQLDGEVRVAVGGRVTIETHPAALDVRAPGPGPGQVNMDSTVTRARS